MTRLKADLLIVLVTLIWGTTFVAQNLAMQSLGPSMFTGIRFLIGATVVAPFAWFEWQRLKYSGVHLDRTDLVVGIGLGSLLFLGAVCQQTGIVTTTVSNAGFLTGLYVLLVPALAYLIHGVRPHISLLPAIALSIAGTWLLSGGALSSLSIGDLWVIAGTLFWAAHILYVGRAADRKAAPLCVAVLQFVVCGLLGCAFGLATEPFAIDNISEVGGAVAYAGVLSVGIAFTLQVVAQRHTPPADAAILMSAEMLVAAIAGAIYLGERLTSIQWTGGILILVSIMISQLAPMIYVANERRLEAKNPT
ncbi:MAG: DMT family transporter [Rhodocyclaceae bacterium]|nr:DMT family transporter [Rhodocyclaceae bacterium]